MTIIESANEWDRLDMQYHRYHPYLRELFPPFKTHHEWKMHYIDEERKLMERCEEFRHIVLQRDLVRDRLATLFKEQNNERK